MTRRRALMIGIGIAFLIAAIAGYLLMPPPLTDQQKIVRLVADAQRAVEARNATGLTRLLSRDYYDASGVTRQQMVGMIVSWMRGGEEVRAVPEITATQINGDFADVQLRVWLLWANQPAGSGEPFRMQVRLRKEGQTWKVISAEGYGAAQSEAMGGE